MSGLGPTTSNIFTEMSGYGQDEVLQVRRNLNTTLDRIELGLLMPNLSVKDISNTAEFLRDIAKEEPKNRYEAFVKKIDDFFHRVINYCIRGEYRTPVERAEIIADKLFKEIEYEKSDKDIISLVEREWIYETVLKSSNGKVDGVISEKETGKETCFFKPKSEYVKEILERLGIKKVKQVYPECVGFDSLDSSNPPSPRQGSSLPSLGLNFPSDEELLYKLRQEQEDTASSEDEDIFDIRR